MVFILPYLTRVIAGVSVPDTPIINASIAFARAELPDYGYNHVMRAWLNGQALINHLPESNRSEIDAEAFGVATILHDLGWSNNTAIVSNDKTFEVDGAIAARNFLQQKGGSTWDKHRIQLVWDAIALHTNNEIYPHKEREVAYTAAGTATELFGPELATRMLGAFVDITVTEVETDMILAEFPKQPGLKKYLTDLFIGFCVTKPQVTYANLQGDFGERYVPGYTRVGKRAIDLFDVIFPDNATTT